MKTTRTTPLPAMLLALATAFLPALTGCGAGNFPLSTTPVQVTVATGTQGVFMGGQQPVANVAIRLYQAGNGGYGAPSLALTPTFYTTALGNFTIPSYSCSSGAQVFILGTGGQPIPQIGNTPAVTNTNLALMSGLGTCGGSNLSGYINVNELTTVATVYALAPFMSGPTSISSSSTNSAGLANSFAIINQLVNTANGTMPGLALPSTATLPIQQLNTLGDIIEQCVNSGGGTASDTTTGCGKLFSYTTIGGVAPTDTVTAMLNIAKNPTQNVTLLNQLRSASPAFTPTLPVGTPPNAWTLAITYTAPGVSTPTAVATDATGNVWITSKGNPAVTKLDFTGTQTFSATSGYNSPSAIAIDPIGNAWITDAGNNTLAMQPAAGSAPTIFSGNGLASPKAITIDGAGNVFVTNTSSVSSFTSAGAAISTPFTGISAPLAVVATPR